jgi:hypothetical protein
MAFANWKSKKLQAAIVAISAIDEVITPVFSPTIATIATIADVESSKQATNDHYENVVVKPVIQKTVRQLEEVSTNGENLKLTAEKVAVEMSEFLRDGESYPHIEDRIQTWNMDRYANMVKCQQCEHLTSTGYCRVKPQYKPMPEAMRDCVSFERVQGERVAIESAPYSTVELNDLLSRYEKKLFHHFVKGCDDCAFMDGRYCAEVFKSGRRYDDLLLNVEDAASKRDALLNTVIRARISGRKVFVSLDHDKVPPPR